MSALPGGDAQGGGVVSTPASLSYHDIDAWGSTRLADWRKDRGIAWRRWVTKELPASEPTDAMKLGTAVHILLLEPDTWHERVYVVPGDLRTKAAREERDNAADEGKLVLRLADVDPVLGMRDAIKYPQTAAAEVANALLFEGDGANEIELVWEEHGVQCKGKVDRLRSDGPVTVALDLKTTADPTPRGWGWPITNWLRWQEMPPPDVACQAAHYLRGLKTCRGVVPDAWLWVVVGSKPPHQVAVYQAPDWLLSAADEQVGKDLKSLAEALEGWDGERLITDSWEQGITLLDDKPRWMSGGGVYE